MFGISCSCGQRWYLPPQNLDRATWSETLLPWRHPQVRFILIQVIVMYMTFCQDITRSEHDYNNCSYIITKWPSSNPKNAVPSACPAGRLPGQRRPDARPVAGQVQVVQGDDDHLLDAGKYQLETSEGFTAFMSEIGVNWFTRQASLWFLGLHYLQANFLSIQIACALYPTATNKNLGGNRVGIDTSSTFKSTSIEFEFGVPFDETTGDGTEVRTTATLSGNSLIKDQVYFKWKSLPLFSSLSIASSIICREPRSQAGFRGSRHGTSRTTVRLWSLCTPSPARPTLDPSGFTKSSNLRPVLDHDKIELDIWWEYLSHM